MGLGVESSQAKALLYYTFAALGGDAFAQMALGYRYKEGVGVPKSCETSLSFYRKAADQGTPADHLLPPTHSLCPLTGPLTLTRLLPAAVEREAQLTGGAVIERKRIAQGEGPKAMSQEDGVQFYQ